VTLFPAWCWAVVGVAAAAVAFSRRSWLPSTTMAALWFAFLLTSADSPASLVRGCLPAPQRGTNLRVVSLNCAGVSRAAQEVRPYDPDVVLLQESPSADALDGLARELYGSSANLVRGYDASIVARGRVTAVAVPPEHRGNFVHARVELDGRMINVISLRLSPCPIRLDLWSTDCWRYYRSNRERRRLQLAQIADYVKTLSADEPLIVGGDFNCPPGDAVVQLLKPRLTDAFAVAGRGWGATIIDVYGWPLIRIDQIWTSRELRATCVVARRAPSSDHHQVVADFDVAGQGQEN
jgi:endonuclease/exonuclease/phosphatase (EEP) superfamily protein YafD